MRNLIKYQNILSKFTLNYNGCPIVTTHFDITDREHHLSGCDQNTCTTSAINWCTLISARDTPIWREAVLPIPITGELSIILPRLARRKKYNKWLSDNLDFPAKAIKFLCKNLKSTGKVFNFLRKFHDFFRKFANLYRKI